MSEPAPTFPDEIYESVFVVIPAYKAAGHIGDVVRGVLELSPRIRVVVVDDGSGDPTSAEAQDAGAEVITHDFNRGKWAALEAGFAEFLKSGRKAVITLDADGQHSPAEIPGLIDVWRKGGADIVIGTRKREIGNMPFIRILTNSISSGLVSLVSGARIRDSQSGYRLHSREVIENVEVKTGGYEAESEILVKAVCQGYKVDSAPISTIYEGEKSHINPLMVPLRFLGTIGKMIVWRLEGSGKKRQR
jgi:glycosyltransferase involved in cell wall biosynthesis